MAIPLIDGTAGQRIPLKSAYGALCNGCGYCCAAEPCGITREFIPDYPGEEPCRAMEFEAGRFVCGMILRPGHYMGLPDWGDAHMGALFAEALGAGKGCNADDL